MTEPPLHAAQIWIEGDDIILHTDHKLRFELSARGMGMLMHLLKERARANEWRIGQRSNPVQYDLDKVRQVLEAKRPPPLPVNVRELLKKKALLRPAIGDV